jgi:MFS family permease
LKLTRLTATIRQHRRVVYLCLSVLVNSLGQGMISPILPLFTSQEFGVSPTEVGLAVGLFGVGRLITSVPAGYLSQKYGRRFVLIAGTASNFLGTTMVAISPSFGWLVGWRIISGLGSSMFTVGVSVYLRDVSTPEARGRYLSLQELSILVGVTVGPLIGGFVGERLGLRVPLFLDAAVMLGALALVVALVPETRPGAVPRGRPGQSSPATRLAAPVPPGAFRRLLLNPGFIFVGLFELMIVANRQGGRFTVMPLYGEAKGFGPEQLGVFISITHFPQFFATLAAGFLSDRFGRKFTIIPATALIALGILVFIHSDSFPELMLSGLLLGLGEGLASPPMLAFFADIAPPGLEGVTMGLYRTFGGAGSLVGALLLGAVADLSGFAWSLGVDAMLLTATALGVLFIVKETAGRLSKPPNVTS